MDFCTECGDLLVVDTREPDSQNKDDKNKLFYTCLKCDNRKEAKPEDYILYSEDFTRPRNLDSLVRYACYDITVPREYKKCPKCKKEEIAAIIRMPNTLKGVYICCKCKNYWE